MYRGSPEKHCLLEGQDKKFCRMSLNPCNSLATKSFGRIYFAFIPQCRPCGTTRRFRNRDKITGGRRVIAEVEVKTSIGIQDGGTQELIITDHPGGGGSQSHDQ